MGGDGCVQARDEPVEGPLFHAHLVHIVVLEQPACSDLFLQNCLFR